LPGNLEDQKMFRALHVGAFTDFQLGERLYLQPELLFSVQGAIEKLDHGDMAGLDDEVELKYSYLNIPVLFSYYISPKWSLNAGPQISVLMSAKHGKLDMSDDTESYDLSLSAGSEFEFFKNFRLSARYNRGFVNVTKVAGKELFNEVFQLSVAIVF
jgi:hypothetical protein